MFILYEYVIKYFYNNVRKFLTSVLSICSMACMQIEDIPDDYFRRDLEKRLFDAEYLSFPPSHPEWVHIRLDAYADYRKISMEEATLELVESEYATPLEVPGWWCLNAPQEGSE